eukprot:GGOE01002101.1.p1 GENE.GGOE01002101.1~~GGOE01002101.1.p1  ORF type:complete len:208 (+),score=86.60 GGOE01002101.1:26-625(+)
MATQSPSPSRTPDDSDDNSADEGHKAAEDDGEDPFLACSSVNPAPPLPSSSSTQATLDLFRRSLQQASARLSDLQQSVKAEVERILDEESDGEEAQENENECRSDGEDGPDLLEQAQELEQLQIALQEMGGTLLEATEKRTAAWKQAEELRALRAQQRDTIQSQLQRSSAENAALRQLLAEQLYRKQRLQTKESSGPKA